MVLNNIDWRVRAIESERGYSLARGGELKSYNSFDFIHNRYVNYSGDFNRVLDLKFESCEDIITIIDEVEELFKLNRLDDPTYIDLSSKCSFIDDDIKKLESRGYIYQDLPFYIKESENHQFSEQFKIVQATEGESLQFLKEEQIRFGYYDQDIFDKVDIPIHKQFIKQFKQYFLYDGNQQIGSFYSASFEGFARLFSIEISEKFQKKGYGRVLLKSAEKVAYQNGLNYLLINPNPDVINFYAKCGYTLSIQLGRLFRV